MWLVINHRLIWTEPWYSSGAIGIILDAIRPESGIIHCFGSMARLQNPNIFSAPKAPKTSFLNVSAHLGQIHAFQISGVRCKPPPYAKNNNKPFVKRIFDYYWSRTKKTWCDVEVPIRVMIVRCEPYPPEAAKNLHRIWCSTYPREGPNFPTWGSSKSREGPKTGIKYVKFSKIFELHSIRVKKKVVKSWFSENGGVYTGLHWCRR